MIPTAPTTPKSPATSEPKPKRGSCNRNASMVQKAAKAPNSSAWVRAASLRAGNSRHRSINVRSRAG